MPRRETTRWPVDLSLALIDVAEACSTRTFEQTSGQLLAPHEESYAVPYINLQITSGATRDQKAMLVRDMTDSLVRVLGKKPEHIHIVIQEINEEDWGYAGLLTDDWKRQQTEG